MKKTAENRSPGNRKQARFTAERRAQLIGHLEAGETLEQACAAVRVSTSTVTRWRKRARLEPGGEAARFVERLAEVGGAGRAIERRNLSREDLIALLEMRATERRCLKSIELLLMRPWEAKEDVEGDEGRAAPAELTPLDELAARRSA